LPVHRIPGKRSGVYALAAEVDAWLRAEAAGGANGDCLPETLPPAPQANPQKTALWLVVAATVGLGIAAVLVALSASKPAAPQLRHQATVINDGQIKNGLFFGGRSLYFLNRNGERWALMRISAGSGAPSSVINSSQGSLLPLEASPDESELLVAKSDSPAGPWALWAFSTGGEPLRKLADPPVGGAPWSPDGKTLAYGRGSGLYLANHDGTAPRKLTPLPGTVETPRWSSDGKHLRFIVPESKLVGDADHLWEVEIDRPIPRRLLPGWSRATHDYERPGRWTLKGDWFVFAAVHDGTAGLFAIRERVPFYAIGSSIPIRLTTDTAGDPTPTPDGKKILAISQSPPRGELIRFDPKSGQPVVWPGMPGLSAGQVAFSPDGRQAAYASYPDLNLWTMNADGTGKRQLTFGEAKGAMPQWSPNGRRIAFMGATAGKDEISKICIMPADGGPPEQPVAWPGWQGIPTWTPDGNSLIFGENAHISLPTSCTLHKFDLKAGRTSDLPNTTGLWTARACPTGRYIAATTRDQGKLVLYDMQTARVTDLAAFPDSKVGDNPTWSKDGKFIFIDAPFAPDPAIYRIRIADKHKERVASLRNIQRAAGGIDQWIGLTPDGSPLVMRRVQGSEIYSWDWVVQ
jgi:Tol biopolymer transport system component